MKSFLILQLLSLFIFSAHGFHKKFHNVIKKDNVGDPVFLTPYIENGKILDGQKMASVKPIKSDVQSYAGYLTVNKAYNSNMFFWYFPAETNLTTAPVVLWLQGGPGASSLYGLFNEIGPFYVKKEKGLKSRNYYWSQVLNVIYIDNPVGTGFSFTEKDDGYVKDEDGVARDLYSALTQFFQLFPNLQKNDFYVAGESYAGKYVPAIAYKIDSSNSIASNDQKINLKGISVGNGFTDPENMMNYGDYLYQIGLIDRNAKKTFQKKQDDIVKNIQAKNFMKALEGFDSLLNGDLTPYKTLFYNETGFEFYFNYLHNKEDSIFGDLASYVNKDVVRRSIHVGNYSFNVDNKVEVNLRNDMMQSVKPLLEKLMDKYRVLYYNGQLDIIVPYPHTVNFLQQLNWSGANIYKSMKRKKWFVGDELAGYSKTVRKFTEVLVRNAGHMVPADQPKWALDLITRFAFNKPF